MAVRSVVVRSSGALLVKQRILEGGTDSAKECVW
jgi:hypothetical protein